MTPMFVLFLVLFIGADGYCMNGWTRYANSCYMFEDLVKKTWQQAYQTCLGSDAHLVVIDSAAENSFIKQELHKFKSVTADQFWTAGNDIDTEGKWIWGKTNDSISLTFWHPGEPNQNGGEEDCLTFFSSYNYDWNDEHCDRAMYYICEIEDPPESIIGR